MENTSDGFINPKSIRGIIQKAFPDIPDTEADDLVSIGEIRSYMPGVILCKEGESESVFYIITDGEVDPVQGLE